MEAGSAPRTGRRAVWTPSATMKRAGDAAWIAFSQAPMNAT